MYLGTQDIQPLFMEGSQNHFSSKNYFRTMML
jgi:hypothetical protein